MVTREDFMGHFEALFFTKPRRLDVQLMTKKNKAKQLEAWSDNERHVMNKEVMKRSMF